MKAKTPSQLSACWQQMTHTALDLKQIPSAKLQALLKETYALLTAVCKDELVPREVTRVFLEIEDFIYFAFLMEDKEVGDDFYCYRKLNAIVNALKEGFLNGAYPLLFPLLELKGNHDKPIVFDFNKDKLSELKL